MSNTFIHMFRSRVFPMISNQISSTYSLKKPDQEKEKPDQEKKEQDLYDKQDKDKENQELREEIAILHNEIRNIKNDIFYLLKCPKDNDHHMLKDIIRTPRGTSSVNHAYSDIVNNWFITRYGLDNDTYNVLRTINYSEKKGVHQFHKTISNKLSNNLSCEEFF